MTQIAIRRSVTFFVASHASRHRNLFLLPEHGAGLRFTVTGRALGFGFHVSLMAEEHIAGQFINALCQGISRPAFSYSANVCSIAPVVWNLRWQAKQSLAIGDPRLVFSFGFGVTSRALQTGFRVQLVVELDGLFHPLDAPVFLREDEPAKRASQTIRSTLMEEACALFLITAN